MVNQNDYHNNGLQQVWFTIRRVFIQEPQGWFTTRTLFYHQNNLL